MKFKRNIFVVLKTTQEITVPEDEFWDVTIGPASVDSFTIPNSDKDFYNLTKRAHLGGGTKIKSLYQGNVNVCITGAAFTAD